MVTLQDDLVNERSVGCMAFQGLIALNSPFFQFLVVTDDMIVIAVIADPDGQRQPPIALLGDHPVMHILQPILLAGQTEFRDPADLIHHIHDLVAQAGRFFFLGQLFAGFFITLAHADEPFIHQPENQFSLAAPAGGVAVSVGLNVVQHPFPLQIREDRVGNLRDMQASEPIKTLDEVALLRERR
jgi:hypothetical protein